MSIPKPQGVTCEHRAAWAYLSVPARADCERQVQYQVADTDGWNEAVEQGGQWLVALPAVGTTRWRARYVQAGRPPGDWATGRAWTPQQTGDPGFEEDAAPRPQAPYALRNIWRDARHVGLAWNQDGDAERWRVTVATGDGTLDVHSEVTTAEFSVGDLPVDREVTVEVRAVAGGVESDPLVAVFPAAGYVPTAPTYLTVVAGETTLELAWAQEEEDFVQHWQVAWSESRSFPEVLPPERTCTAQVYGTPAYLITGLEPGRSYDLTVRSRWRAFSDSTASAGRTAATRPSGDRIRPAWIDRTFASTPARLDVQWEARGDESAWSVQLDDARPQVVTATDHPRYSWVDLEPGSTHTVTVRTQVDGGWLPGDTAARRTFTLDDPPRPPKPAPATGLFFHCIADTTAKGEWSQDGDVDGWEVWLDDDRDQGAIFTVTPLVNLKRLAPGTTYALTVVSVLGRPGTPDYRESDPVRGTFTTLESVLPPDEGPDPVPGDLDPPAGLVVRAVSGTEIEATWIDGRPDPGRDSQFYVVSIDGVHWERVATSSARFTDLAPGRHVVHVYGVFDDRLTGIARKATSLKETP